MLHNKMDLTYMQSFDGQRMANAVLPFFVVYLSFADSGTIPKKKKKLVYFRCYSIKKIL